MSLLRKWFGPSRKEIWTQLSEDIGARYIKGGFATGDKVQATHGEWTVTLDIYVVMTGKVAVPFTRLRAPYVNSDGFRFTVCRRGVFGVIGTFFGMQDVTVGHEPFDSDFIIKGTDESKLRELFADAKLRALVERQPEIKLSVKDDEGWFGPSFPDGVDELHFVVGGIVKDPERLKALYDLFAETLDQLCRIGSAYDRGPNVAL